MMRLFFAGLGVALAAGIFAFGSFFVFQEFRREPADTAVMGVAQKPQKTTAELVQEAMEKSSRVKGLYMTAEVASDMGAGATRLRNHIISLAEKTEINGIVIDVKEVCGPEYHEARLKLLLEELRAKNIWPIARIVVFKDASQIDAHPEWYLTRKTPKDFPDQCFRKKNLRAAPPDGGKQNMILWEDRKGGYWLDPASEGVREYILSFSKKMIDLGFRELQFDYIRFPSDGDIENALYPAWDAKTPKYAVMKSFFEFLHDNLKAYKPDVMLSVDLFGYAATRDGDVGIGQRLEDIGNNFDYISFMVYPSHYYSGFYLAQNSERNLPSVNYTAAQARTHPDIIVGRSMLFARDFLAGKTSFGVAASHASATSSQAASSSPETMPRSQARLRPWLEDFFHEEDKAAGRPSGVEKVRMQIDAADSAESNGWMLWNAANVYTEEALKKVNLSNIRCLTKIWDKLSLIVCGL